MKEGKDQIRVTHFKNLKGVSISKAVNEIPCTKTWSENIKNGINSSGNACYTGYYTAGNTYCRTERQ